MSSRDHETEINPLERESIRLEKELSQRADDALDYMRGNSDSARNFRREVEREYRAEIRQLRDESAHKDLEIANLRSEIATIREWITGHTETLTAAKMIVHAGMVFRYVIIAIVGISAAVGGMTAILDGIKQWMLVR